MRSRYADKFNHDDDAAGYDADVLNEADPIRAGYAELLGWVTDKASVQTEHRVLELGSGSGNLTKKLLPCRHLTCVDLSAKMSALANAKLAADGDSNTIENTIEFVESDLLAFFDRPVVSFDRVVSSYTIHHLTEDEKQLLFEHVRRALGAEGRAVFGDLMFENDSERQRLLERWRAEGEHELVETIEDELFWDLETAEAKLHSLGFAVERNRFSELSWGLSCVIGI